MTLTRAQIAETGRFIAGLQSADGALPWFAGGQWDAWNHTEALMGLTVAGVVSEERELLARAWAGMDHLRETQRPDGSWPMLVRKGVIELDEADTNQCAYPAVGVWHFALATADSTALRTFWPMVKGSIDFVIATQWPDGTIPWAVNAQGGLGDHALLTGCSSILQSLWAAVAIAERLGHDASVWREAALNLAHAVREKPHAFAPHHRHAMDWFYPILGGALPLAEAEACLAKRWDEFVWPGFGVRCVNDHPWVTGGESAELTMALTCLGETAKARQILNDIEHLRDGTGGYWTGYVVDDDAIWPVEQTGWTAGSVLLAEDALQQLTPASNLFRDMHWIDEDLTWTSPA